MTTIRNSLGGDDVSWQTIAKELRKLSVKAELMDEVERACRQYPGIARIFPKFRPWVEMARAGDQDSLNVEDELITFLTMTIFKTTGRMPQLLHLRK